MQNAKRCMKESVLVAKLGLKIPALCQTEHMPSVTCDAKIQCRPATEVKKTQVKMPDPEVCKLKQKVRHLRQQIVRMKQQKKARLWC